MPLALLVGPANAGKVARLLDRYLAALDREPFLVVPNRGDVERVERELIARAGGLLGGQIGTFDDLFRRVLENAGPQAQAERRPVVGALQRSLLLQRVVASASLNGLSASARFPGFADSLGEAVSDVESALLSPDELEGDLAGLYSAYRTELDRLGHSDRELERARAAELVGSDLAAWDRTPVLAYGFEDLTGAQWTLLEALAARADVTVSLPYEPGRAVFASLERTASDLAGLADGRVEELPAQRWYDAPALAHLERTLFTEASAAGPPPLDGAVRFLEAAGARAVLELVGEEILALVRDGTPRKRSRSSCPSVERIRAPLETVFAELGDPLCTRGPRAARTDSLRSRAPRAPPLRLARRWPPRALLLPPLSVLGPASYPGRLRRGTPARARGLGAGSSRGGDAKAARPRDPRSRRAARGARAARRPSWFARSRRRCSGPPTGSSGPRSARTRGSTSAPARRSSDVAEELAGLAEPRRPSQPTRSSSAALERAPVRLRGTRDPGRVAVLDLLRARTRRFQAVFLVGLEEGTFPRRASETPFLPDEARAALEAAGRNRRLVRPDPLARDRYLFYTACTRAWRRLTLAREAATDDGRPREPSPFWEEVRVALRSGRGGALDAPASALRALVGGRPRADRA